MVQEFGTIATCFEQFSLQVKRILFLRTFGFLYSWAERLTLLISRSWGLTTFLYFAESWLSFNTGIARTSHLLLVDDLGIVLSQVELCWALGKSILRDVQVPLLCCGFELHKWPGFGTFGARATWVSRLAGYELRFVDDQTWPIWLLLVDTTCSSTSWFRLFWRNWTDIHFLESFRLLTHFSQPFQLIQWALIRSCHLWTILELSGRIWTGKTRNWEIVM